MDLPLHQGRFLLLKKDEPYTVAFENKRHLTQGVCIDLNLDTNEKLINLYNNELLFKTSFSCGGSSALGNALQHLWPKPDQKTDAIALLDSISSQLVSFSKEVFELQSRLGIYVKKIETKRMLLCKLMASKDFIYQNYTHKITLDQLSRESGISKFHFSRLFKNCFHRSPLELQELLRMQKAQKMMLTKEMRITDIAFCLGYSDLAAFSNQFKKHFGRPPSSFFED